MRSFYFYYLEIYEEIETMIRIQASRKPGPLTVPKCGTWVVRELHDGKWEMPAFPEITWGTLKKLEYIGKRRVHK